MDDMELLLGDGTADDRLGGVQMGGELGDAPAVIQQGLQTGTQVGEAQAGGLLLEVALLAVGDGEAAVEDQAGRQNGLLVMLPMRSECRAPHHTGRHAIIRAPVQSERGAELRDHAHGQALSLSHLGAQIRGSMPPSVVSGLVVSRSGESAT
jgi:hypothetical protein